jgi:imidazolonepropionase-like amidohydrolase
LGQIKPKFVGDFIATKGNPLDDLENLREIDLIIQSGRTIKEIA